MFAPSLAALELRLRRRLLPHLLPEGARVSAWTLHDQHHQPHSPGGAGWTLLQLTPRRHRRARRQLQALLAQHTRFHDLGCEVLAVGPQQSELPTLSDPGQRIAQQLGAVRAGTVWPALLLCDPQRQVWMANRGYPAPVAVLRSLIALQASGH